MPKASGKKAKRGKSTKMKDRQPPGHKAAKVMGGDIIRRKLRVSDPSNPPEVAKGL
jgi:hypothetical protein